jgi:hypothetical protein
VFVFGAASAARATGTIEPAVSEMAIKAAFLVNFAKFTEWPRLAPNAPLLICIVGDAAMRSTVADLAKGQMVDSHSIEAAQPADNDSIASCQILFIPGAVVARSSALLQKLKEAPVLTVSDAPRFSETSGIVEFFVEKERMRFAINVDALQRTTVHVSSRVLGLAKIVRENEHAR